MIAAADVTAGLTLLREALSRAQAEPASSQP
jgi:hypothetical protein